MNEFVHLHLHTQFSLLDGAIRFEPLFQLAKSYKMGACSITDHGNMFGAIDFYFSAQEAGIKPIIGCEAYIAPKSISEKKAKGEDNAYHIILLAMNNNGYKNLIKLVSIAQLEGFYYVPRIDKDLLRRYSDDLICLTACIKGEIPNSILKGSDKQTKELIEEYLSIFGDRLFFELQDNGLEEQRIVNERLISLSGYYNIPIVATNDCHYLTKEESMAHELLLCIQTGKKLSDTDRMSFKSEEFYFKSPEEIYNAFSQFPDALKNTIKIAEMCNVDIDTGTYHFPDFKTPDNMDINDYFERECRRGFEKKLKKIMLSYSPFSDEHLERYKNRLEYEIKVIKEQRFAGYFLIVADFIKYAKENRIPVGPGRGSAAGSLVAYCLDITEIDPIRYNLLFERFLNPERISMPDIDVDFCKKGRDDVIKYVIDKYGENNVAQIITFGTMQSRAAVRDVGRALGIPLGEVDRIAKLIPLMSKSIRNAIDTEPQLRELYERDRNVKELLDSASALEGLARHASTHAAGIVISNKELTEHLPLYKGQKGERVTQYTMKTIEKIGLIKMDFLGLETLTLIDNVIKMLERDGINIDLNNIPLDDAKTYELLSKGDTSGVFQLESRGMRELLVKLRPSKFDDILPLLALYRPGPLKSGMVDEFIKRKNNPSIVKYETPLLEDILKDTYGVIIYQEQIMKIAQVLANFSIKDADALRKAMSKKIPEQLERYSEQFIEGAKSNGIPKDTAEKIYNIIRQFGEYGFNKSHSTAYGLIAYQTAYLKANYYIYYLTAMLTTEVNNTDKLIKYITECREAGIEVLPPDINRSEKDFKIENGRIRFGLSGIKNVGDAALDNILSVRERLGGFDSFNQFCDAIDSRKANKKVLESLAKAGCFDKMGLKRSQILHLIKEKTDRPQKKSEKNGIQPSLFGDDQDLGYTFNAPDVPDLDELSYRQILTGEKEAFGFYFTQHPLEPFEKIIKVITKYDTLSIKELDIQEDVDIVGMINSLKELTTKKGDRMAYVNIEDTKGIIEAIVFPDLYAKNIELLKSEKPLVFSGSIEKIEEGTAKIRTKKIIPLEEIAKKMTKNIIIRIDCKIFKKEDLKRLKEILSTMRGVTKTFIELQLNGDVKRLNTPEIRIDIDRINILTKHFPRGLKIDETVEEAANEILFRF